MLRYEKRAFAGVVLFGLAVSSKKKNARKRLSEN